MSGTEEEDLMADARAAALEEQVTAEAKPAPLEELKDDAPISAEERRKLDTILDIPVTIAMEVGRSQISIRNLLQLNRARWWSWIGLQASRWMYWSTVP